MAQRRNWMRSPSEVIPGNKMIFSRLKQVLVETDGSLGTHLRKLEDAGYLIAYLQQVSTTPGCR